MTLGRLAVAVGFALAAGLGSAGQVAACSTTFPSLEEVLSGADLIFEGEVTDREGGRLTLEVITVYRGKVPMGRVSFGSAEPSTCSVSAEAGQTVIVATDSLDELSVAGVWWVLGDGTLGTLGPEPPAISAEDFRRLIGGLPDTALAMEPAAATTVGVIVLAMAAGSAAHLIRPRRMHEQ